MSQSPELELLERISTPSQIGKYIGKDVWGEDWKPYPFLVDAESEIVSACLSENTDDFLMMNVPPQAGKGLLLDEPIPTPSGWKAMGDIQDGDKIFTHDGTTTTVVAAHAPYRAEAWRVSFDDGSSIICDGRHLWSAIDARVADAHQTQRPQQPWSDDWFDWKAPGDKSGARHGDGATTMTTEEMGQTLKTQADGRNNWRIPTGRIQGDDIDLPVHPYLLGYWLGDGTSTSGVLNVGCDDVDAVVGLLEGFGLDVQTNKHLANSMGGACHSVRIKGLTTDLRVIGVLGNKHVPDAYLRASWDQRQLLLAGILDSDGGISGKSCEISQQSLPLSEQIRQITVSLGGKVRSSERPAKLNGKETGATVYRQRVTTAFNPFLLARKHDRWASLALKARWTERSQRMIVGMEPLGEERTFRCLTVDAPSALYLAGEHMIPTHNTSYSGFLLILWFLGHFPDKQVIFISYSDDYSRNWGGMVRDAMKRWGEELFGLTVSKNQEAASDWKLEGHPRGGMLSVGIGSQITGRSGDLVVIDDVIKNMEEAASATIKKKHLRDWDGTIITRRQPGCTYLITATRFASDDLSGGLWDRTQKKGYKGDRWTQLVYSAFATEDDRLGREPGDPLHTRFSRLGDTQEKCHFARLRNTIDPFTFDCLYQQDPSSSELGMFPPDKWQYMLRSDWPDLYTKVRAWDLAATEGGGDWTVGTLMGRAPNGDLFVLGRYREQHSADIVLQDLKATAAADGPGIPILIEKEKSGAGETNLAFYKRELQGFSVDGARVDGTKEQRARPYEVMQKSERVFLPADEEDAEWVKEWVDEHKGMMGDGRRPKHDDQVDTGAYAVKFLLENGVVEIIDPNDIELNFNDVQEFDDLMNMIGI